MSSDNGTVLKYITAIALLIFLIPSPQARMPGRASLILHLHSGQEQ